MRCLPADMVEYFGFTALGNTALPVATGAGAGAGAEAVFGAGDGFGAGVGAAAGAEAVVGAAVASEPHWALRKSFHFMPLSELSAFAALYFALHSAIVRA